MNLRSLKVYLKFLTTFRNGGAMVRALRGGPPVDEAVLRDGTRLAHPPGMEGMVTVLLDLWVDRCFMPPGFYEPKPGDVVVDCGAHIGLFSVWMARANPRGRVVALEPYDENFNYLKSNLAVACPANTTPLQIALGRERGRGRIEPATGPKARSIDHILIHNAGGDQEVPIVALSDLLDLAKADRLAFLKVDIEGSEHDAFETATPEILSRFERIALEYHDNLRPGTLALLKDRLEPTHTLEIHPARLHDCGVMLARRR